MVYRAFHLKVIRLELAQVRRDLKSLTLALLRTPCEMDELSSCNS